MQSLLSCWVFDVRKSTVDKSYLDCYTRFVKKIKKKGIDLQVHVRDNNVDQALRALKKKLQREGVFREMKLKQHFEKPSVKRAREKAEAIRRARKLARKKFQREGF